MSTDHRFKTNQWISIISEWIDYDMIIDQFLKSVCTSFFDLKVLISQKKNKLTEILFFVDSSRAK